ncbi:MAG: strawberry notch family protein, partial [Leptospiraceae bacterium]|nr:strawberry notch family protein [Leptospiraceae bacterium]
MKSLILADQTGVGKGRVVASVIRWALLHGHKAIFMTYKDTLWFDMIRDLDDIDFLNNKLCTIYNTKKMNIEYNGKNI